jgi:hypothetical protein
MSASETSARLAEGLAWAQLRWANRGTELLDAKVEDVVTSLHLRALSEGERIFYVDAQITNGALDLRVAEQDLHSA